MLSTQNPVDVTAINSLEQLELSLDDYYSKFARQQIDQSNSATKPSLRQNITAINSTTRFDKLFKIFRQADAATRLEDYLTAEWNELKNTYLSYTAIPDAYITKANCAVAMYLQNTTLKPALTYLMPTLKYFKNFATQEDITELPLQHVLKTHICSDNNESLISIRILTYVELNSDFKKFLVNPCFETHVALSENEINRLKSHSTLTDQLISAFNNYNTENARERDQDGNVIKISLKRALEKLIIGLRAGGEHGGRGGMALYAEVQAYEALARFRVYWRLLTEDQKAIAFAIEPLKKVLHEKVNNLQWHTTEKDIACVEQLAGEIENCVIPNANILAAIGLDEDKQKDLAKNYQERFELSKKDLFTVLDNPDAGELHYTGSDKLCLNVKQIQSMVTAEQIIEAEDVLLIIHELQPEEIKDIYKTFPLQITRAINFTEQWITVLLFLNEKQAEVITQILKPRNLTQCIEIANILDDAPLIGFLRGLRPSPLHSSLYLRDILLFTRDFSEAKIKKFMEVYDYESLRFQEHDSVTFNNILPMLIKYTINRKIFETFFEKLYHYEKRIYCKSFAINRIFAFTENADDVAYFHDMLINEGSRSNVDDSAAVYLDLVISALPTLVMTIDDMLNIFYALLNHPIKLEKFLDYMLEKISHITGDLSNLKLIKKLIHIDKIENNQKNKLFKIIYLSKAIKNQQQFQIFCINFINEEITNFITLFTVDEIAELSAYMQDAQYFFNFMPTDKIDAYYAKVEYLYMRNSDQPLFVFENLKFMPATKQKTYIEKNIEYLKCFVTNFVCEPDKFTHFLCYIKILSLFDEKFQEYYAKALSHLKLDYPDFTEDTKAYFKSQISIDPALIQFEAADLMKFKNHLDCLQGFPMSSKTSNEFADLLIAHFSAISNLDFPEIEMVYSYLPAPKNEVFLDKVRNIMHAALGRCRPEKAIHSLASAGLSKEVSLYFFNTIMNKNTSKPAHLVTLIEENFENNFDWGSVVKLFNDSTTSKNDIKFIATTLPAKLRKKYINSLQDKLISFSNVIEDVEEIISSLHIDERDGYLKIIKDKFTVVANADNIQINDSEKTITISNLSYEIVKTHFYDVIKRNLTQFAMLMIGKIKLDADILSTRRMSFLHLSPREDIIFQLNTLSENNIDIPLLARIIDSFDTYSLGTTSSGMQNRNSAYLRHRTQLYAILMCMIILDTGLEQAPFLATTKTSAYESLIDLMDTPEIATQLKEYKPFSSKNPTCFRSNMEMIKGLNSFIEFFSRKEVHAGLSMSMSNIGFFGGMSEQSKFCTALIEIVDAFENYKSTGELIKNVDDDIQCRGVFNLPRMRL